MAAVTTAARRPIPARTWTEAAWSDAVRWWQTRVQEPAASWLAAAAEWARSAFDAVIGAFRRSSPATGREGAAGGQAGRAPNPPVRLCV